MPILFVANAGGHTAQLMALSAAFPTSNDDVWVTNDTAQTRSLLRDRSVRYATYSSPRDLRSAAGHVALARRVLREHEVDRIVSTGSSLAPPFMAVGRARGIACDFIDSATRVDAPSMSGRLVARLPGSQVVLPVLDLGRRSMAVRR